MRLRGFSVVLTPMRRNRFMWSRVVDHGDDGRRLALFRQRTDHDIGCGSVVLMSASTRSVPASSSVSIPVASSLRTRRPNSRADASAFRSSLSVTTTSFPSTAATPMNGVPMLPAPTTMTHIYTAVLGGRMRNYRSVARGGKATGRDRVAASTGYSGVS